MLKYKEEINFLLPDVSDDVLSGIVKYLPVNVNDLILKHNRFFFFIY